MADNITVRDAVGDEVELRTDEAGGVHTPVHLEDQAQREALITALGPAGPGTAAAAKRVTLASDGPGVSALGAPADAEATGTSNGSIIGLLKRLRTLLGGTLSVQPAVNSQTVAELGLGIRPAVTGSSVAHELPALGASRRVRIAPNVRTWLRFGTNSVSATVAGTSIVYEANSPEYAVVPAGATHVALLRDGSVDGNILITPTVN